MRSHAHAACGAALLLLSSAAPASALQAAHASSPFHSAHSDTIRVMVIAGRGPTASARNLTARSLRTRLTNVLANIHAKARVISHYETCEALAVDHQPCDSTADPSMLQWSAASLHASLVMWLDADSRTNRATYTPYVYAPVSDSNPFDEGWTERLSHAAATNRSDALDRVTGLLPELLTELPLINRCQSDVALAPLLENAHAVLARRPSSVLATLCVAHILDRTNAATDSVLALTRIVLSRDPHNRVALWISAVTLDRAMLMDSANIFWRKLDEPGHAVVDSSAGIIHFWLEEDSSHRRSPTGFVVSYRTTRKYSCLIRLTAELRTRSDTTVLGPFRLPNGPTDCLDAVGPAMGERPITLSPGRHVLLVVHAGNTDEYSINLTDSTLATVPTGVPKTTVTSDSVLRRVQHQ